MFGKGFIPKKFHYNLQKCKKRYRWWYSRNWWRYVNRKSRT